MYGMQNYSLNGYGLGATTDHSSWYPLLGVLVGAWAGEKQNHAILGAVLGYIIGAKLSN